MKIILQNIVFTTGIPTTSDLYYRIVGQAKECENGLVLEKDSILSTDTYMNLFDYEHWEKHTVIKRILFSLKIRGKGILRFYSGLSGKDIVVERRIDCEDHFEVIEIAIPESCKLTQIFFRIRTDKKICIKEAYYFTKVEQILLKDIHLSVVVCTYHRRKVLEKNLEMLRASHFFDLKSEFYGRMSIRVVDNASEICKEKTKFLKVYHNPNTGGSGGFSRGIEETLKERKKYNISHIVLMDDDAEFINETFYRLYTFLRLIKTRYEKKSIGGRMFRLDQPYIQYTALETWNRGDVRHSANNLNMCQIKNLCNMNNVMGEYSGWWFACFPISFCAKNRPLPFFLHCDDAEYGLRQSDTPLVLNGIQVWHETYEYRENPLIAYCF